MSRNVYIRFTVVVFVLVAALHLIRAMAGWTMVINNWTLPSWVSWVVGIILLLVAIKGYWLSHK